MDKEALLRYRPLLVAHSPNIILKPADKGSKIVILDRQQYLTEANRQLPNTNATTRSLQTATDQRSGNPPAAKNLSDQTRLFFQ